jgi:hypothetical protein
MSDVAEVRCPAGHVNAAGERFCGQCGAPLSVACPNGHANDPSDQFCSQCGAPLHAAPAATPPPQAPPPAATPPPAAPPAAVATPAPAPAVTTPAAATRYCRNCGNGLPDQAVVCVNCGVTPGTGANFCHNCGAQTAAAAAVCVRCGVALASPGYAPPPAAGAPPGQVPLTAAQVPDYMIWSVLSLLLFWPTAAVAIYQAMQANKLKVQGNLAGAMNAAKLSKTLCFVSLGLGILLYIIVLSS